VNARKYVGIVLALIAVNGAVFAHGPGGGMQSDENFGSRAKPRADDPFSNPVVKDTLPQISMSVVEQTIHLNITDSNGKPMDLDLAEANAFVSSGGTTSIVHLMPVGGNVLSGKGNFVASPDMRVDVTLRLPGRRPINKGFYPLR